MFEKMPRCSEIGGDIMQQEDIPMHWYVEVLEAAFALDVSA